MSYFENYLHYPLNWQTSAKVVRVSLSQQANVRLLDEINYNNYKNGREYHFYGGLARLNPVEIPIPHPGIWHIVIDLGGGAGFLRASVEVF